ncbi:hypothetical protein D3C73_401240 [compost metagenome]
MTSATDLGIVEVLHIQDQVTGGIGPVREERHPASHMHEPGACRLQPLVIALIVIALIVAALRFVGRRQRYRQQAGQEEQKTASQRFERQEQRYEQ